MTYSLEKFNRSVSLLCWAYNEEDLIAQFLERITKLMDACVVDYEIILIDDGSQDKTYHIAQEFQKKNPHLKIYRNTQNMNVGYSSRRAIQLATKEFLFWQTIDWCYDIANLRVFLEQLKEYDIVQGVRRRPIKVKIKFLKPLVALAKIFGIQHITRRSDTVAKAIISVINFIIIRILFRVPLSDFQNVTFYPTRWIQSVDHEAKSSFCNPEPLIKAYWQGMTIKEVPIDFIPRQLGTAKGTKIKSIINSVIDIFRLWFEWIILGKRKFTKRGKICRLSPAD